MTVALILTNVSTTLAQTDTTIKKIKYHFWLGYGGQYFFSNNFHSLGGIQSNLNFSINQKHFIRLEGYIGISTDFELLGPSDTTKPNRLTAIENLSLLYGIGKYQTKYFAIVPSAGISYGSAFWRGKYLYTEPPTDTIPIIMIKIADMNSPMRNKLSNFSLCKDKLNTERITFLFFAILRLQ